MLALPGSAYIYQGEELGLPEVFDIPDSDAPGPRLLPHEREPGSAVTAAGCPSRGKRTPPRMASMRRARAGFRSRTSGGTWPATPSRAYPGPRYELYRATLAERSRRELGTGTIEWLTDYGDDVVAFVNNGVTVITNLGEVAVELPVGDVLLSSEALHEAALPIDTTVWILVTPDQ